MDYVQEALSILKKNSSEKKYIKISERRLIQNATETLLIHAFEYKQRYEKLQAEYDALLMKLASSKNYDQMHKQQIEAISIENKPLEEENNQLKKVCEQLKEERDKFKQERDELQKDLGIKKKN